MFTSPKLRVTFFLLFASLSLLYAQEKSGSQVSFRSKVTPRNVPWTIKIEAVDKNGDLVEDFNRQVVVHGIFAQGAEESLPLSCRFTNGKLEIVTVTRDENAEDEKIVTVTRDENAEDENAKKVEIRDAPLQINLSGEEDGVHSVEIFTYPGWFSLIPPLLAIVLAIITKEVLLALFIGIWAGVFVLGGYHPITGFLEVWDTYIVHALADEDNLRVLIFSLSIGGMIGILANNGGISDMVDRISRWARSRRSGMLATWLMGVAIFFDDYANSLLVGNSMRPITDRLKISREKLAYIVDSTAAPIASLALVSTWIGTEIKYISDALAVHGNTEAFKFFIHSLPFHFYSIFTIFFVFLIGYMRRDYGSMLHAERRAWTTGEVIAKDAVPLAGEMQSIATPEKSMCRWYNAVIPVLVVIVTTLGGLYYTGSQSLQQSGDLQGASLMDIIGKADTFNTLIWAAVWGSLVAFVLSVGQRIMKVTQTCSAWVEGLKRVMPAMLVLILAWTLKDICKAMGTSGYIFYGVQDKITLHLLPVFAFVLSSVVAFATGTSWGTMGLLFPVLLDLAIRLSIGQDPGSLNTQNYIILGTIGSILAGASFGDHCSPISDTTVMSSMACACDHVDHVRTQMPYAVTTGAVAIFLGYLPVGFNISPWICLIFGGGVLVAILHFLGKSCEISEPEAGANGKANE